MSSWNRRAWLLALVTMSACLGDSSAPSAPSNGGSTLPASMPLLPGAIELWSGGPQMRKTASSSALRDRFHLQPLRAPGHIATGAAFAVASAVNLEVLGEGMTQSDGVFVTDISPSGLVVGRVATRAATWVSGSVSPTLLPSRPEWGEHLSRAFHVNSQGDIVGMVMSTGFEPGVTDVERVRIVVWRADGSLIDLPTPVADSFQYAVPHISDAGDVYATISTTVAGPYQIVQWHDGVPQIVAPPPSLPEASVIDVSRSGYLLAGNPLQLFAIRAPDGSWTSLQLPASSSGMGVRALTEDGGAVGVADDPDGTQRGARWSREGTVEVDSLPAGLTRLAYLARNAAGRLAAEACALSGCSFYVLDRGDATPLPLPDFPGGQGSFQSANFGGLSDGDEAVGWYIDAGFQVFSAVRWTLSFAPRPNFPPEAHAGGPYEGTEGSPVQFTGTAQDATPTGTLTGTWSFGDGVGGIGLGPAHTYADNGSFTATFAVTDGEFTVEDTASVGVANAAPQVTTGTGAVVVAGGTHAIQAEFTDPGALDAPWIYVVSWGDGSKNPTGSTAKTGGLNLNHTYKQAGSFRVAVTVTDKDGGVGTGEYPITITKKGGRP